VGCRPFRRVVSKKSVGWSLQQAQILGNVDRMWAQHGQVDHLQRPGVGGSQRRRAARRRLVKPQPNVSHHTPPAYGPVVGGRFTLRRAGALVL
jgi:hypothetical protein